MMSQEERQEKNLFKDLTRKWEAEMSIAKERCNHLQRKIDELESKIKTSDTIFTSQYRMLKEGLQEAYEARENLKAASEDGNQETLNMIKELAQLLNKWRGCDY